jgi:hypothetical protein
MFGQRRRKLEGTVQSESTKETGSIDGLSNQNKREKVIASHRGGLIPVT